MTPRLALITLLTVAAPLAAQQAPTPVDQNWLRSDSSARRVTLELLAGLTPTNGGLNFNGFTSGKLTVVVPSGWEVVVRLTNRDGSLPHSVELISTKEAVPVQSVAPAVEGAASSHLDEGVASGESSTFRFSAPDGAYRLFCAVPGHGMAGMWIGLTVTKDVSAPALRVH